LSVKLTSPDTLLKSIVEAIVEANPSADSTNRDRIEEAMRQLLGRSGRRGRRTIASDEITLRSMAEEYLAGFYGHRERHRSATQLAEWALQTDPTFVAALDEWKMNKVRTMQRKFTKHRNELLAELVSSHDYDTRQVLANLQAILHALGKIGVRASL